MRPATEDSKFDHSWAGAARGFVDGIAMPQTCLVVLNFSDGPQAVDVAEVGERASVLFATGAEPGWVGKLSSITLEPFGVFIGEVP
jgi:hypothetical protein